MNQSIGNISNSHLTGVNQIVTSTSKTASRWLWTLSLVAFALAVLALVLCACHSIENQEFTMGIVIAILSLLVMVLIGWNIFYALGIKDEIRTYKINTETRLSLLESRARKLTEAHNNLKVHFDSFVSEVNKHDRIITERFQRTDDFVAKLDEALLRIAVTQYSRSEMGAAAHSNSDNHTERSSNAANPPR